MRILTALAIVTLVCPLGTPSSTAADEQLRPTEYPYQAFIAAPIAQVFGGPGSQYYATAKLAQGTPVEVHQATGRFLAIRPPAESFSWVPAADIKQDPADLASGVAVVTRDRVASRVGSVLSPDDRNIVHVRLNRGERVRVLARVMVGDAEWVQITPPAGEFRWIRAETISMTDPTAEPAFVAQVEPPKPLAESPQGASAASAEPAVSQPIEPLRAATNQNPNSESELARDTSDSVEPQMPPEPATFAAPAAAAPAASGWVQATVHQQAPVQQQAPLQHQTPVQQPVNQQPVQPSTVASQVVAQPLAPVQQQVVAAPAKPRAAVAPIVGPFQPRIDSLELELSRRVTQSPNRWQFEDIELETARLLAAARTTQEQAAARALAGRIDRFASIAARHRQVRGVAPPVALTKSPAAAGPIVNGPLASGPAANSQAGTITVPPVTPQPTTAAPLTAPVAAPAPLAPQLPAAALANAATTAVGELRTVVSQRPDAPKFALVDPQGRVTAFLTPQGGVELTPMVGKRVAVSGQQGYMPTLRTAHISATGATQVTR